MPRKKAKYVLLLILEIPLNFDATQISNCTASVECDKLHAAMGVRLSVEYQA